MHAGKRRQKPCKNDVPALPTAPCLFWAGRHLRQPRAAAAASAAAAEAAGAPAHRPPAATSPSPRPRPLCLTSETRPQAPAAPAPWHPAPCPLASRLWRASGNPGSLRERAQPRWRCEASRACSPPARRGARGLSAQQPPLTPRSGGRQSRSETFAEVASVLLSNSQASQRRTVAQPAGEWHPPRWRTCAPWCRPQLQLPPRRRGCLPFAVRPPRAGAAAGAAAQARECAAATCRPRDVYRERVRLALWPQLTPESCGLALNSKRGAPPHPLQRGLPTLRPWPAR